MVFSRGQLVEQGRHTELLEHGRVYKELVHAQLIAGESKQETEGATEKEDVNEKATGLSDAFLNLTPTKSGRSIASLSVEKALSEQIPDRKYNYFQLIQKVHKLILS